MSSVLICDKCKKNINNVKPNSKQPNAFVRIEKLSSIDPDLREFDLCWDCYNEIISIITGNEEEKNNGQQSTN